MAGTPDLTEAAPVRRLAVVRARTPDDVSGGEERGTAAAATAVRLAATVMPFSESFNPTHVDLLLAEDDGATVVTLTVQAFARAEIHAAALLGLSAAMVAAGASSWTDIHVVQSH